MILKTPITVPQFTTLFSTDTQNIYIGHLKLENPVGIIDKLSLISHTFERLS